MTRSRLLLVVLWQATLLSAAVLPTPEQFAGFRMGADRKLLRWERIVEYMRLAAASSPRVRTEELGKTSNNHPYISVTISSPETLANLEGYRATQRRLTYSANLAAEEAAQLMANHKAIVLITCNIHATEIGSSQMVLELVHRLATEDSPYIRHLLDNVILVLVPSANPDGQILVTDWYNQNLGTPYEGSSMPWLYHKYTGHDNNRDAFMNTQIESRILNKLTYKDWLPHVFLDEHQMGNLGARIFVPPFKNPINPNVDPVIWQLNGMFGYAMGNALHEKGYTGIINDVMYTSWWQGGFVMQAWWHNMVGLLTEVASVAIATPVDQQRARPGETVAGPEPSAEQMRARDPRQPLPPPRDTTPRNNYPRPWLGGRWTLRDIVDYELVATFGLLEAVANHRHTLIRSIYQLNRRQIEIGAQQPPYAWVIPATQHDPPVATRLVEILDELGVEVHRAVETFQAAGRSFPAGSWVVLMSQPYRAFAKDLLERQSYPVQRTASGAIERPYDVTGWTLPLQMGVEAIEVANRFEAKLERASSFPLPAGKFSASSQPAAWRVGRETNNTAIAINRLLKSGAQLSVETTGSVLVRGDRRIREQLEEYSRLLGISVEGLESPPPAGRRLKAPRTALYQPWTANMDEGWTRWLLEQYEFPYTTIHNKEIQAGGLRERYDAILLADQAKDSIVNGFNTNFTRPEYRGGIGADGVRHLREFVHSGGTLIALGQAGLLPVEEFPLPLKNALKGLRPDQFSCPGSILRVFVDPAHPAAYGMRREASAVFYNDVAFEPAPGLGDAVVRVIARYPSSRLLESGWIGGEEFLQDKIAAAEVTFGKGKVLLLGFSVQNRAQPHGTFKLLFNSIFLAGME
ncbi:MAG: M14 family zinc carboxypeptidase [Bryobacteraceae bacterium]|nr:M14 family zinc carboxypeptidase [Bryobacteraceae bacterium]MDW8380224.1 M14 family metallopeptidase [Bryobacterales bacterium]